MRGGTMNWDSYLSFLGSQGETDRDRQIKEAQFNLTHMMNTSPSTKEVCIHYKKTKVLITSNGSGNSFNEKKITMKPNEHIHLGDYVLWDNTTWILTEKNDDCEISDSGIIEKCSVILRFQNSNGDIIDYPVVRNVDTGSDTRQSTYADIIRGNFLLYIPYTTETSSLCVNQRFMLWNQGSVPEVCKIIGIKPVLMNINPLMTGYLILTMEKDVYNPNTDNIDMMLADYFQPEETIGETLTLSCDKPEIIIGGTARKITSNKDNCTWELITVEGIDDQFLVEYSGFDCFVSCKENYDLLGQTVILRCSYDTFYTEISLKVVSRI